MGLKTGLLLRKEAGILGIFAKEPWRKLTFTELKRLSKKKSKSYLSLVLKRLVEGQIVRRESIGRLPVYSLNWGSPKARLFAGFVLETGGWGKRHIPYNDLERLFQKLPTENHAFIVTGSYARDAQTRESDIDVVILIDDAGEPKKVYAELRYLCEMNIPPIHLYVFRNKEFVEMLLNKQANYGKEIVKNNLILYGGEVYMHLVGEAIEHGFYGKGLS